MNTKEKIQKMAKETLNEVFICQKLNTENQELINKYQDENQDTKILVSDLVDYIIKNKSQYQLDVNMVDKKSDY